MPVARTVLAAGADVIAVARLEHALALREAGVSAPILLYAGLRPDPAVVEAIARHNVTVTVVDASDLAAFGSGGRPVRAVVKVDVGLARLGVEPPGAVALVRAVHEHPALDLAGVYTHLHVPPGAPDDVGPYVEWQFERFAGVLDALASAAIDVPLRIAVSSGAIRLLDGMTLNGIDVGTLLFGLDPPNSSDRPGRDLGLRPALVKLSTRLSQVRDVRRDDFPRQSPIPTGRIVRLGVIPMGASDGFLGISTGEVLVGGQRGNGAGDLARTHPPGPHRHRRPRRRRGGDHRPPGRRRDHAARHRGGEGPVRHGAGAGPDHGVRGAPLRRRLIRVEQDVAEAVDRRGPARPHQHGRVETLDRGRPLHSVTFAQLGAVDDQRVDEALGAELDRPTSRTPTAGAAGAAARVRVE